MKFNVLNLLKYFSLVLVVSFLYLHIIYLVQFGIIIAISMISNNFIKFYRFKNIQLYGKEISVDMEVQKEFDKIDLNSENSRNTLVEIIDELVYIPSINNNNEIVLHNK